VQLGHQVDVLLRMVVQHEAIMVAEMFRGYADEGG
jgi:hypothetical protein